MSGSWRSDFVVVSDEELSARSSTVNAVAETRSVHLRGNVVLDSTLDAAVTPLRSCASASKNTPGVASKQDGIVRLPGSNASLKKRRLRCKTTDTDGRFSAHPAEDVGLHSLSGQCSMQALHIALEAYYEVGRNAKRKYESQIRTRRWRNQQKFASGEDVEIGGSMYNWAALRDVPAILDILEICGVEVAGFQHESTPGGARCERPPSAENSS